MNDVDVLSSELRVRSLSNREIVLKHEDALRAIDFLVEAGLAILGWEGWVRYPDDRVGHHERYQGAVAVERREDEAWEAFVERAVAFCRRTIEQDYRRWTKNPTPEGAALFFCITATDREGYDSPRL